GDAADITGQLIPSAGGFLEILPRCISGEIAEYQRELLVSSHGLEQGLGTRFRIESGICPRLAGLRLFSRAGRSARERRHQNGEPADNDSNQFESSLDRNR